ncbi:reverse transcriptase domain-containing protein [Tanacetum coccineum]
MHGEGASWVEELPNVLWAHRTMPRTRNEETPFSLTYGIEAVIPTEIGMPTHRTTQRDKNEVSKAESIGKLGPKWERPYKVIEAYGTGAVSLKM